MSRPPAGGNAVGHRTGYLNLFTSAYPSTYPSAAAQQQLHTDLSRWSEGGSLLNFLSGHPITPAEFRAAYTDEAFGGWWI